MFVFLISQRLLGGHLSFIFIHSSVETKDNLWDTDMLKLWPITSVQWSRLNVYICGMNDFCNKFQIILYRASEAEL